MVFFRRIYNRYISKDKAFTIRLRSLLGFTPKNIQLFKLAFFHRSNQDLSYPDLQSNERLEYLGDAILSTIVAEYLFKKYPGNDEGFLTKMRAKIVKRQTLNHIAREMELDVFLKELNSTELSSSMLGNALEALIGAIYIECGFEATKKYVVGCILKDYLDLEKIEAWDDNFKSKLLEWSQKHNEKVTFKVLRQFKRNKRDCFKVGLIINGNQIATATDFSKKSAEQKASREALLTLKILKQAPQPAYPIEA